MNGLYNYFAPVDMNIGISTYILTLTVFIPASGWIAIGALALQLAEILMPQQHGAEAGNEIRQKKSARLASEKSLATR